MCLTTVIRRIIRKRGPLSFRDFMEMALYYPGLGYYTSSKNKIGKDGDYFTSASYSSLMGTLLARQLREMWNELGGGEFTIVEFGAGNGSLCRAILRELKNTPELYRQLRYAIIEKSEAMRLRQTKKRFPKPVSWHRSIRELAPISGCVISNEVVDNFAVYKVVMEKELREIQVACGDDFYETERPAPEPLKQYLSELKINLPAGFRTEINLEATKWITEIGASMEKGFVLTVDYGYPSSQLYHYDRRGGTLLCYQNHTVNDLPYKDVGTQDITAHVNFSALRHWGERAGLAFTGYTNQAMFLRALGLAPTLAAWQKNYHSHPMNEERVARFIQTFLVEMGSRFKVLVQHKGISSPGLSGMAFSSHIE